jgi:hypothetical protein
VRIGLMPGILDALAVTEVIEVPRAVIGVQLLNG